MVKERARRRAEREAAAEIGRARRDREVARRARRRAVVRALTPRVRRRRTGRLLPRRSPAQRAGIVVLTLLAIGAIWYLAPDPTLRLVLITVLLLALPVFVVLALGRRT
jgi:Flp pilus assembly protein TadB